MVNSRWRLDLSRKYELGKELLWKSEKSGNLKKFNGSPFYFEIAKLIDPTLELSSYSRTIYSAPSYSSIRDSGTRKTTLIEKVKTIELLAALETAFDVDKSPVITLPIPFIILSAIMSTLSLFKFNLNDLLIMCDRASSIYKSQLFTKWGSLLTLANIQDFSFLKIILGLKQYPKLSRLGASSLVSSIVWEQHINNMLLIGLEKPWLQTTIASSRYFKAILLSYSKLQEEEYLLRFRTKFERMFVWT